MAEASDRAFVSMARANLRKQVMAERAAMPQALREEKSERICAELLAWTMRTLDGSGKQPGDFVLAVYSAFADEVQLDSLIRKAYAAGIKVAFPCMMHDARAVEGCCEQNMEFRIVAADDYAQTQATLAGRGASKASAVSEDEQGVAFMLKPLRRFHHDDEVLADTPYVAGDAIDAMVCPCVAFDGMGNRLGYGGGNYDRYLTQLDERCAIVGAAFEEQRLLSVPVEPHDIPIPFVSA